MRTHRHTATLLPLLAALLLGATLTACESDDSSTPLPPTGDAAADSKGDSTASGDGGGGGTEGSTGDDGSSASEGGSSSEAGSGSEGGSASDGGTGG